MSNTQQFEGATIEAALAEAARVLGPNVQVAEARKVRSGGVAGFFAQERYEVDAFVAEGATRASKPKSMDEAFDSLLAEAEGRDLVAAATTKPAPADNAWAKSLNDFLSEDEPAVIPPAPLPTAPAAPAAPAPLPAAAVAPAPTGKHYAKLAPEATEEARVKRARVAGGEPVWSTDNLLALGVPQKICDHIDTVWPTTDGEWTNALEQAIRKFSPSPARSTDIMCTLGQGRKSAIPILQASMIGIPPGIIYIDGVELVATPNELALAVRSLLPR
ncbi:MAG TPA: hypothetical protein VHC63_04860 [Acidimicrobiales bacterium]|nr:hypothetical protein [Acidimicrobiales bacterium]